MSGFGVIKPPSLTGDADLDIKQLSDWCWGQNEALNSTISRLVDMQAAQAAVALSISQISDPPTQTEVEAIRAAVAEMIAASS